MTTNAKANRSKNRKPLNGAARKRNPARDRSRASRGPLQKKQASARKPQPEKRTASGQFAKGSSGNPGGRPKALHSLKELARERTEVALSTLVSIMEDSMAPAAARVSAACAVLDRGYGKPAPMIMDEDECPLDRDVIIKIYSGKKENYESEDDDETREPVDH